MEPFSLVGRAVFDLARDLAQRRRRVRVRTHDASFKGTLEPAVMINVVNVGQRPVTLTHVWLELTPALNVDNPARGLPKRLEPDEPWETWVPASALGASLTTLTREQILRSARVRLSSGQVLKARPGKNVPAEGVVPGA